MNRALRRWEGWGGVGWKEVINAGIIIIWLDPRADEMKRILFSDWLSEQTRYTYFANRFFSPYDK